MTSEAPTTAHEVPTWAELCDKWERLFWRLFLDWLLTFVWALAATVGLLVVTR